jgi:hypothetical protein
MINPKAFRIFFNADLIGTTENIYRTKKEFKKRFFRAAASEDRSTGRYCHAAPGTGIKRMRV